MGSIKTGIAGDSASGPGVERVIVLMEHCAKNGEHKILQRCTLPLTGRAVVNRIISELGVFDVGSDGLSATELAPGVAAEEVRLKTGCHVHLSRLTTTA